MRHLRSNAGFSLIEITIAVAILGILSYAIMSMFSNTQVASSLIKARNDADRQANILLLRLGKFYMSKKPGEPILAKQASEQNFLEDWSCATDPNARRGKRSYSFSLHNDTEGCLVNQFPNRMLGCKGISIGRGIWEPSGPAKPRGCQGIKRGREVYTVISKCQKINSANPDLNKLSFVASDPKNPLSECTQCPPGERPVVIENWYKIDKPSTARLWNTFPDGSETDVAGDTFQNGAKVNKRQQRSHTFLTQNAIGLELCTHLVGDTVMFDVNAFYVQASPKDGGGMSYSVRKMKAQTSFPRDVITNRDLRYMGK